MKKFPLLLIVCLMASTYACKEKEDANANPLLAQWDTPFGVPPFDKIKPEHYKPAFEAAMKEENREIQAIVDNDEAPSFENVIVALDNSGSLMSRVSSVFFGVTSADTNPELQAIQKEISPLLSAHNDGITMNEALFGKIKSVYNSRAMLRLSPMQTRLLEKTYKRFERSGANLSPEEKEKLKEINQKLSMASIRFGDNLLAENARFEMVLDEEQVRQLPTGVRTSARQAAKDKGISGDKYLFNISRPSMTPFITYSPDRELREQLYKGYIEKGDHGDEYDNKALVNEIAGLRNERAHLLGYKSHAEYTLSNVMAKNTGNVYELLDELWGPALDKAKAELADMQAIKKNETGSDDFESWDWWFYAEKVRKSKYNLDQEALRPYFALENVRAGIFELCNRLYGITFTPVALPAYHPDCQTFEVNDADGSHLAVLYMDFFPRDGKGFGAWCGTYRGQSYENGKRVAPVVTIVCNFTSPAGNTPALLTLDEVETFFHEFGHALHSFFCDVPYKGLRGTERDFVELPSQIMENWAVEPEMLRSYATHYSSGKVIPDDMIRKIVRSGTFNQGFMTTEILAASYIDMDIYSIENYEDIDVNAFEKYALAEKRGLIPQIEPRYRYPYFSHVFDGGYSAGYYSYIWAEVLDKDAYEAFVESGDIFSKKVAEKFRKEILSKGGSADGMTLYHNFRGHEPSRAPLMKSRGLIEE